MLIAIVCPGFVLDAQVQVCLKKTHGCKRCVMPVSSTEEVLLPILRAVGAASCAVCKSGG